MKRSQRMQPIQRLADDRERAAARDLGSAQDNLARQQQQLDELHRYYSEYSAQILQVGAAGCTAARLMELHRFLGTLNQAIEQQKRQVEFARGMLEQKRRVWNEARSKQQAMHKVTERMREEEDLAVARREQKETDEIAGRRRS